MGQENGNEDKIISMSFFPKYFDWFTVQSKKFQLAQQCDIDLVDLGNVTQASHVIQGSDETCAQCLSSSPVTWQMDKNACEAN